MIFVTVGTAGAGLEFTRLIREMDRIAGELGADVLIQRGSSDYEPRHARCVGYLKFDEALRMFRDAELVVGHCGTGTILNAIRYATPVILVPRRVGQGELDKDDHQMQLAAQLEGAEGVAIVTDLDRLEETVRGFLDTRPRGPQPSENRRRMIAAIREFLGEG